MPTPNPLRWERAVQYRWRCEGGCGRDPIMVAVIRRKGKTDLRICRECYADGFWRKGAA